MPFDAQSYSRYRCGLPVMAHAAAQGRHGLNSNITLWWRGTGRSCRHRQHALEKGDKGDDPRRWFGQCQLADQLIKLALIDGVRR